MRKGRRALFGRAPDCFPHPEEVVDVRLQLLGGAADPGGAHDETDVLSGMSESAERFPKLRALVALHPSRDSSRSRVVRHQDQVAAREADERGERRSLVAALFLLDLDDDLLAGGHRFLDREAAVLAIPRIPQVLAGDLLERQKAVALLSIVHEGGVEARLDPDDPALVDVRLLLGARRGLDVHVDEVLSIDERNAQLFRLLRVDQHSFHEKAFTQCRRSSEH